MGRVDRTEVLERVDSAAVLVGPFDAQRVVSDQLRRDRNGRAGVVAGEDAEREPARVGRNYRGLPLDLALCARAHRAQVCDGIDAPPPVVPVDRELAVFLE